MPKIPTHDVRRKDTAEFCLMEFNETSTIYLTVLLKSYVKVSEEEIVFWSKDTAHDVSKVLFYWGYSGSFLVEGDPFDEEGEPSSSKTRKGAKFVPRSSFSLAARNGLRPKTRAEFLMISRSSEAQIFGLTTHLVTSSVLILSLVFQFFSVLSTKAAQILGVGFASQTRLRGCNAKK